MGKTRYPISVKSCWCSIAKSCQTLCDLMDSSMSGFPVLHYLLEFVQTHVHLVRSPLRDFFILRIEKARILSILSESVSKHISVMCVFTKSSLTLCDPTDCSLPGSPVHGILQARILEWAAIFSSRESSWCRDQTGVFRLAGRFFTTEPPEKPMRRELLILIFKTDVLYPKG